MIGRTNTGGGGGGGLNFKIIAYATESALLAANPTENTIGVVTTNKITAWAISAEQPASMLNGGVWIFNGTSSAVAFNALKAKTSAILVYPVTAMQYVSGAWIKLTAKSFQGGRWVDWWNGELFANGDDFAAVTGGWTFSDDGEKAGTYIRLGNTTANLNKNKYVRTANMISLDGRNSIAVHFTGGYLQHATTKLNIEAVDASGEIVAEETVISGANKNLSANTGRLDVSGLNGNYYIQIAIRWTGNVSNIQYADIDSIVCE